VKFLEGEGACAAVGGEIGRERGDASEEVLGSGSEIAAYIKRTSVKYSGLYFFFKEAPNWLQLIDGRSGQMNARAGLAL
jgi:hypothetical protein